MSDHLTPHFATSALMLIDVQEDFLEGGAAVVAGTSAVIPELRQLIGAYRAAELPVVHVIRLYPAGGRDVDLVRRERIQRGEQIVDPGSPGAEIAAGLLPAGVSMDPEQLLAGEVQPVGDHEVIIFKPRWSAFHRTVLEDWLRERGVDTVIVAGCNLPNCPRATLFDASERDLRAVLVLDAVSQTTPERLSDLELIGVQLLPVDAVVRGVQAATNETALERPPLISGAPQEHVTPDGDGRDTMY